MVVRLSLQEWDFDTFTGSFYIAVDLFRPGNFFLPRLLASPEELHAASAIRKKRGNDLMMFTRKIFFIIQHTLMFDLDFNDNAY
jgi:hypothetical protein